MRCKVKNLTDKKKDRRSDLLTFFYKCLRDLLQVLHLL